MKQKIKLRSMSEKQTIDKPVLIYEDEETGHLILFHQLPTSALKYIYKGWLYADEISFEVEGE